jgi:hypothetical protein
MALRCLLFRQQRLTIASTSTFADHRTAPDALGWIRTGWELFLGAFGAALLLLGPALLLVWLGVFQFNSGLQRPSRIVNAPYFPGRAWAVIADIAVGALIVVFAGLVIHGSVLREIRRLAEHACGRA